MANNVSINSLLINCLVPVIKANCSMPIGNHKSILNQNWCQNVCIVTPQSWQYYWHCVIIMYINNTWPWTMIATTATTRYRNHYQQQRNSKNKNKNEINYNVIRNLIIFKFTNFAPLFAMFKSVFFSGLDLPGLVFFYYKTIGKAYKNWQVV